MVQLVERVLATTENRGSNPIIRNVDLLPNVLKLC